MVRHANKDNVLETIKVPLQSKPRTGKTIFAYLRRSTNKKTQEESIETQNKRVLKLAKKLGYTEKDVQIFEDPGFSGYSEVRTEDGKITRRPRKGFSALLDAIDRVKDPCILLVNNYSRLARNADDGGVIIERLGHKGNKQKIEAIYFCIGGDKWDKDTKKTYMQDCFNQAEEESEVKSEYMRANIEDHLDKRIFPPMIPTPPGLNATRYGLEETEAMKYVRDAMKMRIERKTLKEIEKYLKLYGVKTSLANITKTIFENPIYIGEYTDKKTGLVVPDLIFIKGKSPVDRALFFDLQKVIGKKAGGYGEKQRGDIIAPLLRWEQDEERQYSFSVETPKGIYKSYKSGAFGGFNKSEIKIIKEFLAQALPKIVECYYSFYKIKRDENDKNKLYEFRGLREMESTKKSEEEVINGNEELKRMEVENEKIVHIMALYTDGYDIDTLLKLTHEELIEKLKEQSENFQKLNKIDIQNRTKKSFMLQNTTIFKELEETFERGFKDYWKKYGEVNGVEVSEFLASIREMDEGRADAIRQGKAGIIQLLKDSNNEKLNKEQDIKRDELESLQKRFKDLEEEKEEIYMKYADMGYPVRVADKKAELIEKEMRDIVLRINELGESTNVEQFLERLPEVLGKTFELASIAISSEDISTLKSDIDQLIELVTFELQISTKKELKVKLFDSINGNSFLNGAPDKNRTCV